MKKLAIFLCLTICLGLMAPCSVLADDIIRPVSEILDETPERTVWLDCYVVVNNGGAEMFSDGGKKIYGWNWTSHIGRDSTYLGVGFVDKSTDAHSGEYAIRVNPKKGERCDLGPGGAIIPGETYEVTVWTKRLQDGGDARLQILFTGRDKLGKSKTYTRPTMPITSTVKDGWVQQTIRYIAPEFATEAWLDFRNDGPVDILYDDVSMLCITNEMPKPVMPDKKPAIETYPLEDTSFEGPEVGAFIDAVPGWTVIGSAKITDKYAHTGQKSVELYTGPDTKDAIGQLFLTGIKEGAVYQFSSWVMNPSEIAADYGYWVHWCSNETYVPDVAYDVGLDKDNRWGVGTSYQWQEFIGEVEAPKGAKSAMVYFRHRLSPGHLYIDDVAFYMVRPPLPLRANTDETFYYTEWKVGKVNCEPYFVEDGDNCRADFTFLGLNGEVLDSYSKTGINEPFSYEFPLSFLAEKGERYHVNMKVYSADGTILQDETYPVFRYDRPTYLGADGIFRKNGKEIPFVMGSGLNMDMIAKHPEEGGITVGQLVADRTGIPNKERMDAFYEQGMFVLVNCYTGNKTAGHPDLNAQVVEGIKETMNHPALFGYKIIDEPSQRGISDEEMITAYKSIRDIDPHHPIYVDDSPIGAYDWLFRYCDIFDCDYYAGSNTESASFQSEVMDEVMKASKGRKPFSILQQAFQAEGSGYIPTVDENRHMRYQAFFSGAFGYGYHTLGDEGNGAYLDRPEWKETVEKWAPWEHDFALGCFVTGEYKFVNYQRTDTVLWGTFTDDKDLYAIVLNRSEPNPNSASIPLTDGAGVMKIGNFTAVAMTGDTTRTVMGNGTLDVNLAPHEATVWKITPTDAPLNTSHLVNSKFRDVIYYPWAYNAIAVLEARGIVNKVSNVWYGPGEKITRGDYAMFLVRTLGLTNNATENFADVEADAEYAKELAIGRAAGIINGVGDNKFNPTAQITRQDMMTMTSRAMSLAGSADLSAFSDAGNIADYAASHVSAMVAEGLIKGNADGTINPLGNTTRAEAAVIMQRILNK